MKKWTNEEISLLRSKYGTMSLHDLKSHYLPARHVSTIYNKARSLNLKGFQTKQRVLFEEQWTPELSYFIGLIASDGCLYRGKDSYVVSIKLQKSDRNILDKLHNIFKIGNTYCTSDDMYTYRIYSKSFYNFLIGIGLTEKKSKSLTMPDIPSQFIKDFVRGYFDGDGYIYYGIRKWRSGFCSASPSFLKEIQKIIQKEAGVSSNSISKSKHCFEIKLYIKDTKSLCKWMYYKDCLSMERKRQKAEKLVAH